MKLIQSLVTLSLILTSGFAQEFHKADVIVYGGTSAGVIAAVQAKQLGKSVMIVSPDKHLGGLSSGGLGWTDTGKKDAVGGLSREFYERVYDHYQDDASWNWQDRSDYTGSGTRTIDNGDGSMWMFEPHVAEKIFEDYVKENNIIVHRDQWLDRKNGVEVTDHRITRITTLSKAQYEGKIFIDATYEGDLMGAAGVGYHIGREPNSTYALFARILGAGWNEVFEQFDILPNHKTDTNNHGPFNTDNIGMNYDYPDGSYERRREIIKEHEVYQKEMSTWGLAKDEFTDNGNSDYVGFGVRHSQ